MATRIRRAPDERAERTAGVAPDGGTVGPALVVPVIAAHGGCGASTLARFLGDDAEEAVVDQTGQLVGLGAGRMGGFPGIGATSVGQWAGRPVVVVGQGTAQGAACAASAAGYLHGHGLVVVVAIVGDGPLKEPIAVRARARAMRGWASAVVRVPYVPRWRFIDYPADPPGDYAAAVERVRAATRQGESGQGRRQSKRKDNA